MEVVDVHTHMLNPQWLELVRRHGGPKYSVDLNRDGDQTVFRDSGAFMVVMPGHMDYALRVKDMDDARVDLAVVSLTCPNVYFGDASISLAAAKLVNDDMAAAQTAYPDRIRWMASLPWQHADDAVAELKRAHRQGAVGVMVLANIDGTSLTDPAFAPVWQAIDDLALPVLVHPTAPPGTPYLDMRLYSLIGAVGFMMDTTLAVARMIYDGFLDRYPNLKIIAAHAGGTLPYLVGRLDQCHARSSASRAVIEQPPSEYLRRICYDSVTYRQEALQMCIDVGGVDNVMYGSDYPHNIGDMKGCLERVDNLAKDQSVKVRNRNALRIFRL